MTVLFSDNFDSGSGTLNPSPGFTTALGAGLRSEGVGANTYVSASRAIGANGFGDCAYVAAAGEIGDKAVRTAFKWNSQHATATYMGHLLRFNNGNRYYTTQVFTNGTDSIKIFVYKYDGGYSEIASSGFVLAVSAGDVVHHESKVSGTTIESRIWKNSEPRPATPTVSVTDVTDPFYSGYAGLHKGWSEASTAAYCDDVVITDGAGGEDFFYPPSSGASGAFTITSADATFSGGGVVRPMASFAVTAENTTFSGSAGPLVSAWINATTDAATFAGGATGDVTQGTITCPALKNNTGTVLANETGITAYVYSIATGAHVATKTGQATNTSGVLAFTDAAIAAGTTYRVVVVLGSGAEGMDKVAAT